MPKIQLTVKGMSCASCVGRVEKALNHSPAVESASVNLVSEKAAVTISRPERLNEVVAAVTAAGYQVQVERQEFLITGMSCASCVNRIEKGLKTLPGVIDVSVNLATDSATVSWSAGSLNEKQIEQHLQGLGYSARTKPKSPATADKPQQQIFLLLSFLLTIPLVVPMLLELSGQHLMLSAGWQLLLATPVQFIFGARFYVGAFQALKHRTGNMDLLVAMGTSAAYGLSLLHMVQHKEHLYFESSAVIISLVLLGKYLEQRAKRQTTEAIRALEKLRPTTAVRIKSGQQEVVVVEELQLNDLVLVKAGDRIPVDGKILEGQTEVDESMLTGESLPVLKGSESNVTGGSMNISGAIKVQVTAIGSETMLAKITRLVEEAQAGKAPIQRLVDKVSAVFVPVVIILAFITLMSWGFISHNWEVALVNAIAVLVIACPCALGLATPTSIMVGTGMAARAGILIKDAEALEITRSLTVVAFDKTGTLTQGQPSVAAYETSMEEQHFWQIIHTIQQGSSHPLAEASVRMARQKNASGLEIQHHQLVVGKGIEAGILGEIYLLGNHELLNDYHIPLDEFQTIARAAQERGESVSFLADQKKGKVLGFLSFKDGLKSTSLLAVKKLKSLGIKTLMISGDNEGSARRVAQELGLDLFHAHVMPQDKTAIIEQYRQQGEIVGMVGDGINDAPALARAHVGMAMATGTDVAMHSAGITLMRGNPVLIADAISISRRTYRKIQQNLFWAFVYNVIGLPLAALGYLSPVLAGAAMALSSVSVVTNSLLLRRWQPAADSADV